MQIKLLKYPFRKESVPYLYSIYNVLSLTCKHFFQNMFRSKNIVTIQYPEIKRTIPLCSRTRHRILRNQKDGKLLCQHCQKCSKICPSGALKVNEKTFEIDLLKCCFCGLCVAICPEKALQMDTGIYKLIADQSNKSSLIYKETQLADLFIGIKN